MAGFFGLFDYTKPGKGVRKDEPKKPRFLHFWELFFRKFWKLIQLNLLYVLFCIPIVTIGPATAAMTFVLRNMANEKPVFLFSDFWDAFKENWKKAFLYSLLFVGCWFLVIVSVQFYSVNSKIHTWMLIPAVLTMFIGLMLAMSSFYVMLMIVTLDLPLKDILKNSVLLSVLCVKTNLLTLLFTFLLAFVTLMLIPLPFPLFLYILLVPAWLGFIICYNSYPGIHKYAIEPYLAKQEEARQSGEESLFQDEKSSEDTE